MKKILVLVAMVFVSAAALAKTTPVVDPTYVCTSKNDNNQVIAYAYVNVVDQRVWVGSEDRTLAFEVEDLVLEMSKCPNCYNFSGIVKYNFFGTESDYEVGIKGSIRGTATIKLTLTQDVGPENDSLEYTCVREKR
jgi:hypothetical protein